METKHSKNIKLQFTAYFIKKNEIEQRANGSLSIGFTSCDPSLFTQYDMSLNRNELIEANSYVWLVEHDVFDNAVPNDIIKIRIDCHYNVLIKLSNEPEKIIMNVFFGETSPLYLFIDLFGRTTRIRIMNFQIDNSHYFQPSIVSNSKLMFYLMNMFVIVHCVFQVEKQLVQLV